MTTKMKILIAGIKLKLDREEALEDILASYTNLSDNEKSEIRIKFN